MKTRLILLTLLITGTYNLHAQDILSTNLSWAVTSLHDINTNADSNYSCTFVTRGTGDISWVQKSRTTMISVLQTQGSWQDVSVNGTLTYDISIEGQSGKLSFSRGSDGLSVTLDLSQSQSPFVHQYKVSQVTPQ